MSPSPSLSLFDSNYSLSTPSSASSSRLPSTPSFLHSPNPSSPIRAKPLDISFSQDEIRSGTRTPPLISPTTKVRWSQSEPVGSESVDSVDALENLVVPVLKQGDAHHAAAEAGKEKSLMIEQEPYQGVQAVEKGLQLMKVQRPRLSRSIENFNEFDACLQDGIEQESKAGSCKAVADQAHHHLLRAKELTERALQLRPSSAKAMQCRARVLIQLATQHESLAVGTTSLQEAVSLGRRLVELSPASVSAHEMLARATSILSAMLLETGNPVSVWEGPAGELAREALQVLEDTAADKMDRMRSASSTEVAAQAPSMADTFLTLAAAAIAVSELAPDLQTVDLHVELAEQALEQASNMATVPIVSQTNSGMSTQTLITHIQLASGRVSLERLRHTFLLGIDLDEDDFRALLADTSILAAECRERATKLKGSKRALASSLAWEALKQLGEAQVIYANLLRILWRERTRSNGITRRQSTMERTPVTPQRPVGNLRRLSTRTDVVEATIQEEDEDDSEGEARRESATSSQPSDRITTPTGSVILNCGPTRESGSSKSQAVRGGSEDVGRLQKEATRVLSLVRQNSEPISLPTSGRRRSWQPTNQSAGFNRRRRVSSQPTSPAIIEDITAWTRKPSFVDLTNEDEPSAASSMDLARTALELLEGAIKHFKLALPLVSSSDMPSAQQQRCKSDTLRLISYTSTFLASLSPHLALAAERRASNLTTAEVYAIWAAREVGWSFLIEGTREAALADRRTTLWRADESGKRAVLVLLRTWWFRTATNGDADVQDKVKSRNAVEIVVKRMQDKEGVNEGDITRFKAWLLTWEGEMDPIEELFWDGVLQILRG